MIDPTSAGPPADRSAAGPPATPPTGAGSAGAGSADPYPFPGGTRPERVQPAPRRRRTRLIVGLLLAVTLLLCAGGGFAAYLLVRAAQPAGAADPAAAVNGFLTAVFAEHDETEAAEFVCPAARDTEQLAHLIEQVIAFEEQLASPRTTWDDPVVQVSDRRATATVRLTLTTEFEQVAHKQIRVLLVDQRGWWVCDVEAAG